MSYQVSGMHIKNGNANKHPKLHFMGISRIPFFLLSCLPYNFFFIAFFLVSFFPGFLIKFLNDYFRLGEVGCGVRLNRTKPFFSNISTTSQTA